MRIRIFRAPTLAEAMAQIRAELGSDALILSDRVRDDYVEVTAALETNEAPALRAPPIGAGFDDLEPFTVSPHGSADRHERPAARSGAVRASTLATTLMWHGLSAPLVQGLSTGPIESACARLFRFASLKLGTGDDPLLLAGPPGGGKTLTVARLATRLVMAGEHPLVITADGKRAGAVEQLAAFTRLLGLTMVAASTPAMLARALARREGGQPVLIDAPGLDLADPAQSELLTALRSASGAAMTLVLPCGLDPNEAEEIACAHASFGAHALVATRTDQSRRMGGILRAAAASGLALCEAGTGSGAADSLVAMTPRLLASLLSRYAAAEAPGGGPSLAPATAERITRSALPIHIAAQRRAASNP